MKQIVLSVFIALISSQSFATVFNCTSVEDSSIQLKVKLSSDEERASAVLDLNSRSVQLKYVGSNSLGESPYSFEYLSSDNRRIGFLTFHTSRVTGYGELKLSTGRTINFGCSMK